MRISLELLLLDAYPRTELLISLIDGNPSFRARPLSRLISREIGNGLAEAIAGTLGVGRTYFPSHVLFYEL